MAYKLALQDQAAFYRQYGMSLIEISRKLGIAKSTVSLWVRNIQLPKDIRQFMDRKIRTGLEKGLQVMAAKRALQKINDRKEAEANIFFKKPPHNKDFWKFIAALLFWCEGSKRQLSTLTFTNSDPTLVNLFLSSLKKGFDIDEKKIKIKVHLHEYHNKKKQMNFWSKITGIPLDQFSNPYLKPNTKTRIRANYPGCASINYGDAKIARKLDALYHVVAEKLVGV